MALTRRSFKKDPAQAQTMHLSFVQLDSPPMTNRRSVAITSYNQSFFLPTGTSDPTSPTPQEGAIYYKTDTDVIRQYDGSSWSNVGAAASLTLDQAFDNGKVVDGATSAANAVQIGDGTDDVLIYTLSSAPTIATDGTSNLTIAPDGGTTAITGALTVSTTIVATGNITGAALTTTGAVSMTGAAFTHGADGAGYDHTIYPSTASAYWLFDASEDTLVFENTHLHLNDSERIAFGQGSVVGMGDFTLQSDGTNILLASQGSSANPVFRVGDATNNLDMEWLSTTSGAEVTFDASALEVIYDGVDARFNDDDFIIFGDDGDFTLEYDNTNADLQLRAGAAVASQKISIGGTTNQIDLELLGATSGDLVLFDASLDKLILTDIELEISETATDTESLDIGSAAVSVDVVNIASSGALDSGKAALTLTASGAIKSGGNILRVVSTGTPATGAIAVQVTAAGDDIEGVNIDTDCDSNANTINCGGDLAAGNAVLYLTKDGSNTNKDSYVLSIASSLDMVGIYSDINNATNDGHYFASGGAVASGKAVVRLNASGSVDAASSVLRVEASGKDMYGVYVDVDGGVTNSANVFTTGGALAAGKGVVLISADGTPNQGALLRCDAAKNCYGVYSDVDATTEDCNLFNTGANTASGKAIVKIVADAGTPNAAAYALNVDWSAATLSGNPTCVNIKSAGTGAQLRIETIDTGAAGVQIQGYHTSTGSAAAGDAVFVVDAYGLDAGNASTLYCKIECEIQDATAGQEDGRFIFSAAAHDSTLTQMAALNPRVGGALAELVLGASNTNAYVTTNGTGDLILDTNQGTNSGVLTILDGANGNMTLVPNGTGMVLPTALGFTTTAKTTTATLTVAEGGVVTLDSSGGVYTVTLPAMSAAIDGLWYWFKKTDVNANAVTIDTPGGETIDGAANNAEIDAQYDALLIVSDGSNWHIVQRWIH